MFLLKEVVWDPDFGWWMTFHKLLSRGNLPDLCRVCHVQKVSEDMRTHHKNYLRRVNGERDMEMDEKQEMNMN